MAAIPDIGSVQRNPAYPTWEAERSALVLRQVELESLIPRLSASAAEETYQRLLADGFDEEYCRDNADAIDDEHAAQLNTLHDEKRSNNARLSIIKPLVTTERLANNKAADKSEYNIRLFGYLDRIATALEKIAGCKSPAHKSNGRKAKPASTP